MRKSIVKTTALVILVALLMTSSVLVLSACNKSGVVQKGIVMDPTAEPITETGIDVAMKEIIYGVFEKIDNEKIRSYRNNPSDLLKSILALADEADRLLKNSGITNKQYADLKADLHDNRDRYTEILVAYVNDKPMSEKYDKKETADSALTLALVFCSILGKDKFSTFAHDLYKFRLQYVLDKYVERKNNGEYGLDTLIENAKKDLKIFNSLDLEEFKKLLCGSLLVVDMFSASINAGDFTLSDSETAKLLQIPDLNVDFNVTQWNFILQKISKPITGYFGSMFEVADGLSIGGLLSLSGKLSKKTVGDKVLAESSVFSLILNIQDMFDEDMIKRIREINSMSTYDEDPEIMDKKIAEKKAAQDELVIEIISKATDKDWDLFKDVISLGVKKDLKMDDYYVDAYSYKAYEMSGATKGDPSAMKEGIPFITYFTENIVTYDDYLKALEKPNETKNKKIINGVANKTILITYTSEQAITALKNATAENIRYVAEGVLGGISPAFSYGLHNTPAKTKSLI